jgi:hypothetical protein
MAGAPQLACAQAQAEGQDLPPYEERGWEAGARYWWSQGKTQWSHNAQGVDPTAGNPTSVLTYDRLAAHSIEFHGAKHWHQGWFITGNAGVGRIYKGNFNDTDYDVGQVKFSETNSSINEGQLGYLTVDGGYNVWRFPGGSTVGFFGGLQYWTEVVDANGLSYVVRPSGQSDLGSGVNVITNEVRWASLRTGVAFRSQFGEKVRLVAQLAVVPVASMENDDSHRLRTSRRDLGAAPNVTMEGSGYGYQLDAELRYAIYKSLDLGIGARYWKLTATGDVRFAGRTFPLTELESTRYGLTLSLINRW